MSGLAQRSLVKDRAQGRGPLVASLDIGSSKTVCMIARRSDGAEGGPKVIGAGVQSTRNAVRSGAVRDIDGLERAVRLAVEQAERAAEIRISEVVVGVSGPDLRGEIVRGRAFPGGRQITADHVRDAREAALSSYAAPGRAFLHAVPLGFALDGAGGVRDPRGMYADALTASFLVVTAPVAGLRNLLHCVTRAQLEVSGLVASPYASGLAVLVDDEAEQGATVIDVGAGVTAAAAFSDGALVHIEVLPIGSARATADLAQGIGTTFAAAERMKIAHGAVGLGQVGALELVDAPRLGPDGRLEAGERTRSELVHILRPRFEELFELMEARLSAASAAGRPLPRRIVLTGGGSQLLCLQSLAEDVFRAPVRIARPSNVRGLPDTFRTPAFASAAGLLRYEIEGLSDRGDVAAHAPRAGSGGLARRVAGWIRENF
jgi:cell division protein FtsA